jgi:hypothetical protein
MTDTEKDVHATAADSVQDSSLKSVRDELRSLMFRRRSLRTKLI